MSELKPKCHIAKLVAIGYCYFKTQYNIFGEDDNNIKVSAYFYEYDNGERYFEEDKPEVLESLDDIKSEVLTYNNDLNMWKSGGSLPSWVNNQKEIKYV